MSGVRRVGTGHYITYLSSISDPINHQGRMWTRCGAIFRVPILAIIYHFQLKTFSPLDCVGTYPSDLLNIILTELL